MSRLTNLDIIRAWKDAEYRNSLTDAERAALPENPAGLMRVSNQELENVVGGATAVRLQQQISSGPVMHSVASTTTCGFWGTACDTIVNSL